MSGSFPRGWGMLQRMLNKRIGASSAKLEPDWLRRGFLVGSGTTAARRRAESHSPLVRGHWELRKRIFPPLKKKYIYIYIERERERRQNTCCILIASKTNKSLAL